MQFLLTLLVAAVASIQIPNPPKRSESVLVRAVLDGDTIDVATVGRVRLLGIDAPEVGRGFDTAAPFGREARDRLSSLVLHRWVRLESESTRRDVYNRHLAYVLREDGVFVNAVLVREGLARISARVPLARLPELQSAEREAQMYHRGMWGPFSRTPSERHVTKPRKLASKPSHRYTAASKPLQKPRAAPKKKRVVPG